MLLRLSRPSQPYGDCGRRIWWYRRIDHDRRCARTDRGEIEDEYDLDESDGAIVDEGEGRYRVKALTEIGQFNAKFDTALSDSAFDTIGGLLTERLGHVPKRGDVVELDDLRFEVMRADARRPHLFLVTRLPKKTVLEEFADNDEQRHPA